MRGSARINIPMDIYRASLRSCKDHDYVDISIEVVNSKFPFMESKRSFSIQWHFDKYLKMAHILIRNYPNREID